MAASYIPGYDSSSEDDASSRRMRRAKKPTRGYSAASMERRMRKKPPVGAPRSGVIDPDSDDDLGSFSRSYTPGVSSFYRSRSR